MSENTEYFEWQCQQVVNLAAHSRKSLYVAGSAMYRQWAYFPSPVDKRFGIPTGVLWLGLLMLCRSSSPCLSTCQLQLMPLVLWQRLAVSNNKLTVLPTDVAGLILLKRMALSNNLLSTLPTGKLLAGNSAEGRIVCQGPAFVVFPITSFCNHLLMACRVGCHVVAYRASSRL